MVRPKGRGNAGSRLCIVGLRRLLTKRCFFLDDSIDYVAFVGLFLVTPGIKITGRPAPKDVKRSCTFPQSFLCLFPACGVRVILRVLDSLLVGVLIILLVGSSTSVFLVESCC